jgi:hypothetical protein
VSRLASCGAAPEGLQGWGLIRSSGAGAPDEACPCLSRGPRYGGRERRGRCTLVCMTEDLGDEELVNTSDEFEGHVNEQDEAALGEDEQRAADDVALDAEDVTTGGVHGQGGMGNGVDGNMPEPGVPLP